MEASLCAGALGLRDPNSVPNTPRADAPAGRLPTALLPLAGLMFFCKRCSSVTVLVSQYESAALSSCCRSIWLPTTPMMRSNREVRSAWKARHCRQQRKTTMAASGRPRWKPRLPARAARRRSSSALRRSCSIWFCFACDGWGGGGGEQHVRIKSDHLFGLNVDMRAHSVSSNPSPSPRNSKGTGIRHLPAAPASCAQPRSRLPQGRGCACTHKGQSDQSRAKPGRTQISKGNRLAGQAASRTRHHWVGSRAGASQRRRRNQA